MPTLTRRVPETIFASPNKQIVYVYGTKLNSIAYCTLRHQDGTVLNLYLPLGHVTKVSDTQIRLNYAFLKRGGWVLTAFTLDGRSNEFPFSVN